MRSKLVHWIWQTHSCLNESMAFVSRKAFFRNLRFYFKALEREASGLGLKQKAGSLDQMILVGAGPLPYTGLFYRKYFKQIICIEKNWIAAKIAAKFIAKQKINNIRIVCDDAINFNYPDNCLIYIVLLTQGKQAVLAETKKAKNALICVRQPLAKEKQRYEFVSIVNNNTWVDVPALAMRSILIDRLTLE